MIGSLNALFSSGRKAFLRASVVVFSRYSVAAVFEPLKILAASEIVIEVIASAKIGAIFFDAFSAAVFIRRMRASICCCPPGILDMLSIIVCASGGSGIFRVTLLLKAHQKKLPRFLEKRSLQ